MKLHYWHEREVYTKKGKGISIIKRREREDVSIIKRKEREDVFIIKREKVYEFISEQLRKGYIRSLKLPQTALIFFVEKKNSKK